MMRGRIALCIGLTVGLSLLLYSLYIGVIIGADWYGKDATFLWHMNNYIVMEAQYAYSIFGLATMAIGGLATGLAMAAFTTITKTKKHIVVLAAAFFVAIALSGLGFNTLDFMLGSFYWTNMTYPPPVMVPLIGAVDVWNFYFFFFVVPLWFSGFLMGTSTSYYTFIYKPRRAAAAYIAKKNPPTMLKPAANTSFIAESTVLPKNQRGRQPAFDTGN
jgi:hypothetical protein